MTWDMMQDIYRDVPPRLRPIVLLTLLHFALSYAAIPAIAMKNDVPRVPDVASLGGLFLWFVGWPFVISQPLLWPVNSLAWGVVIYAVGSALSRLWRRRAAGG